MFREMRRKKQALSAQECTEPEGSKRSEVDSCRMRGNVEVFALSPEHISGKQAIPLR